jgi:heptosyltransferase-2
MPSQAVLMPNWIGDLLLALSVAERKKNAEKTGISLIVPERLVGLAKLLSDLPVLPYRRSNRAEYIDSVRTIQRHSFSKLYILPHSFSSALFGFKSRIPVRRGVSAELRGGLLTERLPSSIAVRTRHLTHEYSEVLETPWVDPDTRPGKGIKKSGAYEGTLVLCPGAAYGPAKQWPHFDRLAMLFPDKRFVILGDARDAEAGERIAAAAPQRVVTLAGATSLEEAAAIIAGAPVLVSNDSGLLHMSGYLGTPCVGIYGSTSSVWTRPLGKAVRTASGACPRSPCFERTCPLGDYRCLRDLMPESVAALIKQIIR